MSISHRPQQPAEWSATLCGCDAGTLGSFDPTIITWLRHCFAGCITCLLPCITFGQIAEIVDEGQTSCVQQGCIYGLLMLCSCQCLLSCVYREKLRTKFGLPAEPCDDCCVHFCCETCALCQEHAELKNRGFDPSRGWIGPPNAPPAMMPPTMTR